MTLFFHSFNEKKRRKKFIILINFPLKKPKENLDFKKMPCANCFTRMGKIYKGKFVFFYEINKKKTRKNCVKMCLKKEKLCVYIFYVKGKNSRKNPPVRFVETKELWKMRGFF